MTNRTHSISAQLAKAYQQAHYVIHGEDGEIQLRVGQASPELAALMQQHATQSAAFLTAYNPYSVLLSAEENARNHNALINDIAALGLKWIAGEGADASNLWPSEPSVLALGITLHGAELLADQYQQNAFLWIARVDGLVRLNLRYPIADAN